MPSARAASTLVVRPMKWRATSCPPCCANQAIAECALVMVSAVVKVLEATRNTVLSARKPRSTACSSWPSTLETKCRRLPGARYASSARTAMAGPRSEPPMPMLTMSVMRSSARTRSAKSSMAVCSVHAPRPAVLQFPADRPAGARPAGRRSRVCSTARCSVVLIGSPRSMASRCASRPQCAAMSSSRASVCRSQRFLDSQQRHAVPPG
jgi:hypothetical protein